ncbi:MAG: hypothetical protein ACPGSM_12985, partial [Thiolinea sp.]
MADRHTEPVHLAKIILLDVPIELQRVCQVIAKKKGKQKRIYNFLYLKQKLIPIDLQTENSGKASSNQNSDLLFFLIKHYLI